MAGLHRLIQRFTHIPLIQCCLHSRREWLKQTPEQQLQQQQKLPSEARPQGVLDIYRVHLTFTGCTIHLHLQGVLDIYRVHLTFTGCT